MTHIVLMYLFYLAITIGITVWVAHTLHKNGRVFLVDAFKGNELLADSVNHLLVVGFYLLNIGYVSMALKSGESVESIQQVVETLSTKVGYVLIILGFVHFFNLSTLTIIRRVGLCTKNQDESDDLPPVEPSEFLSC